MTSIEFMVLPVSTGLIQESLGIELTIPMALGPSSSYGACPGKRENGKALGPPSFYGACPGKLGSGSACIRIHPDPGGKSFQIKTEKYKKICNNCKFFQTFEVNFHNFNCFLLLINLLCLLVFTTKENSL